MQDTALIVVEAQRAWFSPTGPLRGLVQSPGALDRVQQALARLLAAARRAHLPVLHTPMSMRPGHPELGHAAHGLRQAIKHHGLWTGEEALFAEGLEPHDGELVIRGRTGASAFAGTALDSILRNNRVRRVVIAGVAAQVCVLSTVLAAHDLGYDVVVPRETTVGFSDAQASLVLDEVAPHFAWVKPLEATLEHLERRAGVVDASRAFLAGLYAGDAEAVARWLDSELVVEGWMDERWQRWSRDVYLERVHRLGGSLDPSRPADIVRVDLVGSHAEIHTRVPLPTGHFEDRLSWSRDDEGWRLRHKTFQFHGHA